MRRGVPWSWLLPVLLSASAVGCSKGSSSAAPSVKAKDQRTEPPASAAESEREPAQAGSSAAESEREPAAAESSAAPKPRTSGAASGDPQSAYRRPGDAARGVDEFIFWGWSEDGRYYAFETYGAGPQMANCEGEAELTIVDASTDRYAEDGHIRLAYDNPEAEVCDPPDLRAELALRRDPRLERFGIVADHLGGPVSFNGGPQRFTVTLPDGGPPIGFEFRVKHQTDDPMNAADGAAYVLRMTQPGMSEVVVERGRRRRPWTMRYSLDDGMVFVGPKGRHAAVMVAQIMAMPEGTRTTWMSNAIIFR